MSLKRNNAQTGTVVLGDVSDEAFSTWEGVSTSIANGASSLWSGIKSGLGTIADGVRSAYNYITDGISNTATGIVNLFGSATAAIAGLWRGRRQEEGEGLEEDLRLIEINDRLTYLNNLLQNGIQLASLSSSMSTDSDITPEQAAMLEMENARKECNALIQEQNEIISGMETAQREENEQKLAEGEEGGEEFEEDSDDSFTLMESPMGPGLGVGGFNIFRPSNSETNSGESGKDENPGIGTDSENKIAGTSAESEKNGRLPGMGIDGAIITDNPSGHTSSRGYKANYWAYDIYVPYGTEYTGVAGGKVIINDRGDKDYGKQVILDHGSGVKTSYAHNSEFLVTNGQVVDSKTILAKAGNSGHTASSKPKSAPSYGGTHIHYELRIDGQRVDSSKFDWNKFNNQGRSYVNEYLKSYGPGTQYWKIKDNLKNQNHE